MTDLARVFVLGTGLIAGFVGGMVLALLFSALWPIALMCLVALPFGWYASHRPWHGKRKNNSFGNWVKTFYGPPLTRAGRDGLAGFGIGLPTGLYFFGRIVWSA